MSKVKKIMPWVPVWAIIVASILVIVYEILRIQIN